MNSSQERKNGIVFFDSVFEQFNTVELSKKTSRTGVLASLGVEIVGRPLPEPLSASLVWFRRAPLASPRPASPRTDPSRLARLRPAQPCRALPVGCPGFGLNKLSNSVTSFVDHFATRENIIESYGTRAMGNEGSLGCWNGRGGWV